MAGNTDIKNYLKQLNSLGYVQYQLDNIIKEAVGTVDLSSLNEEQQMELAAVLQDYVNFAIKCRQSLK